MIDEQTSKFLTEEITKQLDGLVSANHCGAGTIVQIEGDAELRTRISSVDRLACEVETVTVAHPRFRTLSLTQLQSIADEISEQLTYLEERLVVLEVDQILPEIQLRSDEPRVDTDARTYFEVRVDKAGVCLQRFSKTANGQRTTISAAFTRSVFIRVCADLLCIAK